MVWAEHLRDTESFYHSNFENLGENIAYMYSPTIEDALDNTLTLFYEEGALYDFVKPPTRLSSDVMFGHFTQMIWKDSVQVGIGHAFDENTGRTYFVLNYWPPGNVHNMFHANVLPTCKTDEFPPPAPTSGRVSPSEDHSETCKSFLVEYYISHCFASAEEDEMSDLIVTFE